MAKKAIVMGATSGIGMEVAKLLAAKDGRSELPEEDLKDCRL